MLLVCGATGELGGRVARRLAARGVPLRVLVRGELSASFVDQLDDEIVLASVMGLSLFADLDHAHWTDEPLRALGIRPRGVREYAHEIVRGAT